MAIPEVIELFDSGAGSLTRNDDGTLTREITLRWLIKDKASYALAEQKLRQQAPDVWAGYSRQRLDLQPLGSKWWIGTALYVTPSVEGEGDEPGQAENLFPASVSFDTTGGTEHITQAYYDGPALWGGETAYARGNAIAPSYEGAINVNGDQVNGIDVVVPVFNFTETWTVPTVYLTDRYVNALYRLTGKTNNALFRVFEPGECLFLGARGDLARGDYKAVLTFSFSCRPNQRNLKAGQIEVNYKEGWQYLWIEYENSVDNANLIKRPKFAYVNDIYGKEDFSQLGIGTTFPQLYGPSAQGPNIPQRA